MTRWGWLLAFLPLAAGASMVAPPRAAVMQSVYGHDIAAPPLRAARRASCEELRGQSIPVDRSTEETTERSEWAGMRLLTRQMDCRFLGALYAELRYAAVNRVLGEGAWRSCLRVAPVGHLTTAPELGIYLQCLRLIAGTEACQTAKKDPGPYSVSGHAAACAQVLRRNDWSQWGEPEWSGTPSSLFQGRQQQAPAPSPRGMPLLRLPTPVTLRGRIRTGFFLNCCLFGMGFIMPFTYLHLPHAVTVADPLLGTVAVRDIELDHDVTGGLVDKPTEVSCGSLQSGVTSHYALSTYCRGTQIHRVPMFADGRRSQSASHSRSPNGQLSVGTTPPRTGHCRPKPDLLLPGLAFSIAAARDTLMVNCRYCFEAEKVTQKRSLNA